MEESKAMMKKEVAFMKKKGAPKSMIKHEKAEMADKMGRALKKKAGAGRAMMKYAEGGSTSKPEKKSSGFKKLLGTLSPLYGMVSGHGAFGKNDLGILPALARRARKRRADGSEMTEAEEAAEGGAPPTMRRGGKVSSASNRADGCVTKGKTRGKFV